MSDHHHKIKQSLRYSLWDGIFASIMLGLSETFIVPYALAMKAGAGLIGMLVSMPNLVGAVLQVKSANLAERLGSRKALINSANLIHALMWIPIIAIPYIFKDNQVIYLIVFYTLFVAMNLVAFPAWSSLMSDHVSEHERGRVFGWRNRVFGLINVSAMFLGGLVLNALKKNVFLGFTVIFTAAFLARLVSLWFLARMHEPEMVIGEEHRFTLFNFMKRIRRSNFGRFVLFVSTMNFAVTIAAPFLAVYMLGDLKFSYLTYAIVTMTATITMIFAMRAWGVRADHVGNMRVLRLTSIFISVVPLLWILSGNVFYLLAVQVFAGFFWAGFNLSAFNFIYDAVTPPKRIRCIAYFNVINGIALFSGATIGGFILKWLPPVAGYKILMLCLISGVLRFFAAGLGVFVKEVRAVKSISNLELFYSVISRRPIISPMTGGKE